MREMHSSQNARLCPDLTLAASIMLFMQETDPVTIWNWLGTFIILMIPIVNLIVIILTLLNPNARPSKKNFFLAQLILGGIVLVIGSILYLVLSSLS